MRFVAQCLTIGLVTVPAAALVGCDTESHKADKKIQAALSDATAQRAIRNEAADLNARKIIEGTAHETGGSPQTRAQLAAMHAQVQVDAALALIRQIDQKELELARASFNLGQFAVQLDTGSQIATGFGKYDPKAARDKIAEQITAAQGGPDKQTWEYQSVTMPTLAAVKAKISDLEGQIAKLEEEAKSLSDQRDKAMADSEVESKAADATKRDESLEHFKKFSGLRKQAGDLYTQMEATNARTIPLKSDLAIQQGQLDVLNNVIKELTSQGETLDTGWKAIQQQIDAQNTLAKQIVGSESAKPAPTTNPVDDGATMAEKVATIAQWASEIATLRQQAQTDLDDAAKLFNDAYNSAEQGRRDLTNMMNAPGVSKDSAGAKAADVMMSVINSQVYHLREASTHRLIGALYASEAASVTNRVNLQASVVPVIERVGATVPAEIRPGNLAKQATAATAQAEEAYKAADAALTGIINGIAIDQNVKNAAQVEYVLSLYGQSQVARLEGSEKNAGDLLAQAIAERQKAVEGKIKLPALPAELTPAPPPAPEAPAPSTEPTTAPTEGATPATEPTTEPAADPAPAPATQPG